MKGCECGLVGPSLNDAEATQRIVLRDNTEALRLFGLSDANLRRIEAEFPVRLVARGNEVFISGPRRQVMRVELLLHELIGLLRKGQALTDSDVVDAIRMSQRGEGDQVGEVFSDVIVVTARGRAIRPKSPGQKQYAAAIKANALTFGIGPAGTGKTYLAMAMAIAALKERQVHRIVLTRPAVEAGEKLGFLPGDLQEKVNPYLRPLYDALYDILGVDTFEKYMGRGVIEVAPLAYMRGRTLDDSFIILDEAQNTTPEQMKMFLTRLGFNSKAVVTGDITQVDLPRHQFSGLQEVRRVLSGVEGIAFVHLTEQDVVRHPLVQKIILAYEAFEAQQPQTARTENP